MSKLGRPWQSGVMRLGDYYRGLPLRLATKLPPEEVKRRINDASASPFRPFATGVVGGARFGRVRLSYRSGLFGYNAKPVLTGPIRADRGGSLLPLVYRGPWSVLIGFPIIYITLALFISIFLAFGEWAPGIGAADKALVALFLVAASILPLGVHAFAIRNAEADLEVLAAFLRSELSAHDVAPRPS